MTEDEQFHKKVTKGAAKLEKDAEFQRTLAASSVGKYIDRGDGIIKLTSTDVREEQAEWEGKPPPKPKLKCCQGCHTYSVKSVEGNCGLQGHEYGCPKCDQDESF